METKNEPTRVLISTTTLTCLKKLLFSDKGGVDFTPIVNDLAPSLSMRSQMNRDLVAINIGLTFKGIKPEIDKRTRYSSASTWNKSYKKYEFESYSMIMDDVIVKVTNYVIGRDGKVTEQDYGKERLELETWCNLNTSPDEAIKQIKDSFTEAN